jgi:hypothetical protein
MLKKLLNLSKTKKVLIVASTTLFIFGVFGIFGINTAEATTEATNEVE